MGMEQILQDLFEPEGIFCSGNQEQVQVPSLDVSSTDTSALALLNTVTSAAPTEASVNGSLLRSRSFDEVCQLAGSPQQPHLARELPRLPSARSEDSREPVFSAGSAADKSHVEIALEMPRYLLQEDEALCDETIAVEEARSSNLLRKVSMTTAGNSTRKVSKSMSDSCTLSSKTPLPFPGGGDVHCEDRHCLVNCRSDSPPLGDSISPKTSHHRQFSQSNKAVPISDTVVIPPLPSALAVCIPVAGVPITQHSAQPMSTSVTPNTVPHSASNIANAMCEKKKRRHGGGWPKGKSRKLEGSLSPPKPPPTGYAIFASEKRHLVQKEHGTSSMAKVSKILGQMWSQLSPQTKELYYNEAQKSRTHYFSEMKTYFSLCYKGAAGESFIEMEKLMNANTAAEENNHVVSCGICQLSFTSLNNKRSHYSGRLHLQALTEHLHQVFSSKNACVTQGSQAVHCEQTVSGQSSKDTGEQLGIVAAQYTETVAELAIVRETYRKRLEENVKILQELNELEYMESRKCEVVASLKTQADEIQLALDSLTNAVTDIVESL